jgi:hypothetical protein
LSDCKVEDTGGWGVADRTQLQDGLLALYDDDDIEN